MRERKKVETRGKGGRILWATGRSCWSHQRWIIRHKLIISGNYRRHSSVAKLSSRWDKKSRCCCSSFSPPAAFVFMKALVVLINSKRRIWKITKTSHNEPAFVCIKLSKQSDLSSFSDIYRRMCGVDFAVFQMLAFLIKFWRFKVKLSCARPFLPLLAFFFLLLPRFKADKRANTMEWDLTDFSTWLCVYPEKFFYGKTTCSPIVSATMSHLDDD